MAQSLLLATVDWTSALLIPLALGVVGSGVGFVWPYIQTYHRRRKFQGLLIRELQEVAPFQGVTQPDGWWDHERKRFLHREILAAPTENRDFILSLDAGIVYLVTQLWAAREDHNAEQWLYCLDELAPLDESGRILRAHSQWVDLIGRYRDSEARPR